MKNYLTFDCQPTPPESPIMRIFLEDNGVGINIINSNGTYHAQRCTNREVTEYLIQTVLDNKGKNIIPTLVRRKFR